MKANPQHIVIAAALALTTTAATAQVDLKGKQYAALSVLEWDAETGRTTTGADFNGTDMATGFYEVERNQAGSKGVRLLTGYRINDWLAMELHIGTGGSDNYNIQQDRLDVTLEFPDDFDFSQFEGMSPQQIAALDPADFPEVTITAEESQNAVQARAKLNQVWGLFLRPSYTFAERLSVYGLVGYAYANVDYRTEPSWYSESASGLAYGAGLDLGIFSGVLDGNLSLTLDYVQYLDEDDLQFDAMSVGIKLAY